MASPKIKALFQHCAFGALRTQHRVVLAPLTRQRAAEPSLAPTAMNAEYYRQRASLGGLLISEATCISGEALGYPGVPGIWTDAQVAGWKAVTDAVHRQAASCAFVCQLWHVGRVAHPSFAQHPLLAREAEDAAAASAGGGGAAAYCAPGVSSSAVPIPHHRTAGRVAKTLTYDGLVDCAPPRALAEDELPRVRADYVRAAKNAMRAGFDGVEVHAAHGYLLDQFLCDGVNARADGYGGSVANRCRLLFEVVRDVCRAVGAGRVGVRLSPTQPGSPFVYHGCADSDPHALYAHAVEGLNDFPLAYILFTEPRWTGSPKGDADAAGDPLRALPMSNGPRYRPHSRHALIGAGGFTPKTAGEAVHGGVYDAVAFGRWFLANPDLPERVRQGHDLNVYDRPTFYARGAEGYTDYPSWRELANADGEGGQTTRPDPKTGNFVRDPLGDPAFRDPRPAAFPWKPYPLLPQRAIGQSLAEAEKKLAKEDKARARQQRTGKTGVAPHKAGAAFWRPVEGETYSLRLPPDPGPPLPHVPMGRHRQKRGPRALTNEFEEVPDGPQGAAIDAALEPQTEELKAEKARAEAMAEAALAPMRDGGKVLAELSEEELGAIIEAALAEDAWKGRVRLARAQALQDEEVARLARVEGARVAAEAEQEEWPGDDDVPPGPRSKM